MNITEKIEGYADLSAEEKLKALEGLEIEESNNDEEIEKYKNLLQKANSEAAGYKKQMRDKLTEQEKLEAERQEELQKKDELLKSLLKEKDISKYQANFLKIGLDSELAEKSAKSLSDGDIDSVFANLSKFTTGLKKSIESELLKRTPDLQGNNGGATAITKEQFNNMNYKEMKELKEKDPDLFNSLVQS